MLTAVRITHFNIYYTQKITQSNSSREEVARKTLDRSNSVQRFFDFFCGREKKKRSFLSKRLETCREQDSPCTTLIRFCLFVPSSKLAKSKFRIVCQKWIFVLRHLVEVCAPQSRAVRFHLTVLQKTLQRFSSKMMMARIKTPRHLFFAFQTCKCQEFLTEEPAVGPVYIESERSLW